MQNKRAAVELIKKYQKLFTDLNHSQIAERLVKLVVTRPSFSRVVLVGLATDFCVHFTAVDARREGFGVVLVEDGCRAIDLDGSLDRAMTAMRDAGVIVSASDALLT